LGWLQIVPFAFGLYSNFYFLGGSAVGWLFVQRIFWEETVGVLILKINLKKQNLVKLKNLIKIKRYSNNLKLKNKSQKSEKLRKLNVNYQYRSHYKLPPGAEKFCIFTEMYFK